jgi:hypothetical protein
VRQGDYRTGRITTTTAATEKSGRWSEAARAKAWLYRGGCRQIDMGRTP